MIAADNRATSGVAVRVPSTLTDQVNLTELADYQWLVSEAAARWLAECAESTEPHMVCRNACARPCRLSVPVWWCNKLNCATKRWRSLASLLGGCSSRISRCSRRIAGPPALQGQPVWEQGFHHRLLLRHRRGLVGLVRTRPDNRLGSHAGDGNPCRSQSPCRSRSESARVRSGSVEQHPPTLEQQWHLDPDRRTDGRRSTHVEWDSPEQGNNSHVARHGTTWSNQTGTGGGTRCRLAKPRGAGMDQPQPAVPATRGLVGEPHSGRTAVRDGSVGKRIAFVRWY